MVFVTFHFAYWQHGLSMLDHDHGDHMLVQIHRISMIPTPRMIELNQTSWEPGWNNSLGRTQFYIKDNHQMVRTNAALRVTRAVLRCGLRGRSTTPRSWRSSSPSRPSSTWARSSPARSRAAGARLERNSFTTPCPLTRPRALGRFWYWRQLVRAFRFNVAAFCSPLVPCCRTTASPGGAGSNVRIRTQNISTATN